MSDCACGPCDKCVRDKCRGCDDACEHCPPNDTPRYVAHGKQVWDTRAGGEHGRRVATCHTVDDAYQTAEMLNERGWPET